MSEAENKFVFVKTDESASEHIAAPKYSYWSAVFKKFFSSKATIAVLIVAIAIVALSIIDPIISGYNGIDHVNINNSEMKFVHPCLQYLFGTNNYGDNLWNVVWIGSRNSLAIAGLTTLITTVLGVIVGAVWGYSKKMDKWMSCASLTAVASRMVVSKSFAPMRCAVSSMLSRMTCEMVVRGLNLVSRIPSTFSAGL